MKKLIVWKKLFDSVGLRRFPLIDTRLSETFLSKALVWFWLYCRLPSPLTSTMLLYSYVMVYPSQGLVLSYHLNVVHILNLAVHQELPLVLQMFPSAF